MSSVDRFRLTCFRASYSKQCQFDYSTQSSLLIRERPRRCETSSSRENSSQPKSRLDGPWDILAGDRGLVSVHANVYPSSHHKDRPSDLRTENFGVRDSCTGNALARIIHERFCCKLPICCYGRPSAGGLATRLSDFATNCHEQCGLLSPTRSGKACVSPR